MQKKIYILLCLSGICLAGLFVGGPSRFSPRSYKALWDLGHVVAFSLWSYMLLRSWRKISTASFLIQCVLVLFFTLCVGVLIEIVQGSIGRSSSLADVLNDLLGSLITLACYRSSRQQLDRRLLRVLQLGVLGLVLVTLLPFAYAVLDEAVAKRQFPVLSNFETPFEIGRWKGNNAELTRDRRFAKEGHASLKVSLSTAQYSGAILAYFPRDWRRFQCLQLDIFTESPTLSRVHCRIHDIGHAMSTEQAHDDRFNATFALHQGWNTLTVSLKQVHDAPLRRDMDLAGIDALGIFVVQLPAPETLYIDRVHLIE
ncbi:hypothetical protein CSB45_01210 [candidate division KSB3 bacterium]|uniref:VanZ-like domain-containing protein n=1 Tax=candidate division KSB3 bacterium TaxID=2044937 RepID=A0A2G6EAF7_9BACT|nr:MAG: hypothetical protein CSB45_01210 [candidate division KSB3 bacterium]PIE30783.1 MAG: hypothetical protein CSA57_02140 [candidate division KSB3 bacterium]